MLDSNLYEEHKSTVTSSKLLKYFLEDFVWIKIFLQYIGRHLQFISLLIESTIIKFQIR